jgi:nucleoid-associated protein YejK
MKAILEFNLPEDQRQYEIANQAYDMFAAVAHFEDRLRSYQKYGHEFKTAQEAVEAIRALLHEELNIRRINIHDC